MIDKREIGGKPIPPDTKKAKAETLDVAILSNAWRCPFCDNLNGIPEIAVCRCGARREGTTATK